MTGIDASYAELQDVIRRAFAGRGELSLPDSATLTPYIDFGLRALDRGELRAATPEGDRWVVHSFVQELILLAFMLSRTELSGTNPGAIKSFDKLALKFTKWDEADFRGANVRVVPHAVVRYGAYVGQYAVLMPCFVNIGAYIGERTMIDTWSTIGSCAQVGSRCHISGGVGIGGVLEPVGQNPVVIEDEVFVGARSEIAEGVRVRRGAVIGMGVYLGASTAVVDRASGEVYMGEVPENAVVVPGARRDRHHPDISVYSPIIVKYADRKTRQRTSLNELVRTSVN